MDKDKKKNIGTDINDKLNKVKATRPLAVFIFVVMSIVGAVFVIAFIIFLIVSVLS